MDLCGQKTSWHTQTHIRTLSICTTTTSNTARGQPRYNHHHHHRQFTPCRLSMYEKRYPKIVYPFLYTIKKLYMAITIHVRMDHHHRRRHLFGGLSKVRFFFFFLLVFLFSVYKTSEAQLAIDSLNMCETMMSPLII